MDTLSDLTAAEKHLWQRVRMEPADGEYPVLVVCPKRRRMRSDDWDGFFFVLFWNALSWFSCGVALMRPPSEWGDLIFMWGVLGVLFLAGLGLIVAWGWHYYAARRAVYVLTNQRALIQTPVFLRRTPRVRKFPVDSSLVRSVRTRKDGSGDIVFGWDKDEDSPKVTPYGFMDVPDVRRVEAALDARIARCEKMGKIA